MQRQANNLTWSRYLEKLIWTSTDSQFDHPAKLASELNSVTLPT